MEEPLAELLLKTADMLHWLGKYRESAALTLLSRLVRARKVDTREQLEQLVAEEEAKG